MKVKNKVIKLSEVVKAVRAKYGRHSIYFANEAKFLEVHREPTGIYALDFAIGGGYPYGRYIHVYSAEGVGKTFIAMTAVAEIHKNHPNSVCIWIDLERVFDSKRAAQVGVDLSRLILINEESIEMSISVAESFINVPNVKCFVFDSVAALITIAELENSVMEQTMGVGARLLNRFLRRWTAKNVPKKNKVPESFVLLLNQIREKIQKGGPPSKIPPKPQPTGGRGLRFFTSIALELAKGEWVTLNIKDDDNDKTNIGHDIKCLVIKNNTFPPMRVCKFMLCTRPFEFSGYKLHANSVDNICDLLRYAIFYGVVQKKGKWLFYEGKKWNGRANAQTYIFHCPLLAGKLYRKVMDAINVKLGVYKAEANIKSKTREKNLSKIFGEETTG